MRQQRAAHLLVGLAGGPEHGSGAEGLSRAACVLPVAAVGLPLAGKPRPGLTDQPSQVVDANEPQLVGRTDRFVRDSKEAAPDIDFNRWRVFAAMAISELAALLAVE